MVKACLNQKIIKNSNLIKAMKNSIYPKAKVVRRPNFPESVMCPNTYRMFRNVDLTHDRITYVRKRQLSEGRIFPKTEFVQKFTECSEVWIEHTTW